MTQEKLAVLLPGLGAVSTTVIAGVELIRRNRALPIGSVTQLGTTPDGAKVSSVVPLARVDQLAFGAWDIVNEDGAAVARRSGVLSKEHIAETEGVLSSIRPKPGVHDPDCVRKIAANHVSKAKTHREKIEALRQDIRDFRRDLGASRAVMIFCASTETYRGQRGAAVESLKAFERGLDESNKGITPTMLYAYAAIAEHVPFANGTPNASVDTPALQEFAARESVPICGRDFKSGQTMMKTALAPAFRARMLGLEGWFSTNILGNRDGEVLEDPDAFRSKEVTKSGVLDTILEPEKFPELYGKVSHKVCINYYPPRGDAKEGWDNIDIFGWLGYPMQIKIDFLCRDSILAAPLVVDLALFTDLAARKNKGGIQEWLSFYFKSPMPPKGKRTVHDLFQQHAMLMQELQTMRS